MKKGVAFYVNDPYYINEVELSGAKMMKMERKERRAHMYGKYKHSVDPKGRLFVPSKLREELGEAFYVTLGLDHCLSVYTEAGWQAILDKYNALPISQARKMRFLFANAAKCEPDKQGRFLIPAELRQYAGITQDVTFIGQGGHAEIWDSEAYDELERQTLTPENLTAAMEELGF